MCVVTPTVAMLAAAVISSATAIATSSKAPKQAPPPTPEAPPQAARLPDEQARRTAQQTGTAGTAGPARAPGETMLTGPGGVSAGMLNLGRNTLLGQ